MGRSLSRARFYTRGLCGGGTEYTLSATRSFTVAEPGTGISGLREPKPGPTELILMKPWLNALHLDLRSVGIHLLVCELFANRKRSIPRFCLSGNELPCPNEALSKSNASKAVGGDKLPFAWRCALTRVCNTVLCTLVSSAQPRIKRIVQRVIDTRIARWRSTETRSPSCDPGLVCTMVGSPGPRAVDVFWRDTRIDQRLGGLPGRELARILPSQPKTRKGYQYD